MTLTTASQVPIDRPSWVWDNRIPVGGVALMAGDGGVGKTMFVCWSAARLSRGELPGVWFGRPADVLYVGLEDDRATVTVPRLVAAGADLDRFHFVDIPSGATFSVGVDLDALLAEVRRRGLDVALVVLDPLDSHMGGADTHRKNEVQTAIGRLAVLAQKLRCGALGLAHLTKGESREFVGRVIGSVAFRTGPRSVLGVGPVGERSEERACVLSKANWADLRSVPAIRFRIDDASVAHPEAGSIKTARVVVVGEDLGITANDLVRVDDVDDQAAPFDDWVGPMLAEAGAVPGGSPMRNTEVEKYAREAGFGGDRNRGPVFRGRKRLTEAGLVVVERIENGGTGRPMGWSLTAEGFARWGDPTGFRAGFRAGGAREFDTPSDQERQAQPGGFARIAGERAKGRTPPAPTNRRIRKARARHPTHRTD